MTDSMSNSPDVDPQNPYGLTPLEEQVVDLLLSGLTSDEVADVLAVERRSVASRRASAMRKYGARSGMHLAHLIEITRRAAHDLAPVVGEDVSGSLGL